MLSVRLLEIVRRRWVVVLIGIALTGLTLLATTKLVAPKQSITATILILPPSQTQAGGLGTSNPYLQLGGLTSPVEVLARALNDPKVHDRVVTSRSDGDYLAERDLTTSAPVMLISIEAPTLADARLTRDRLLKLTPDVLSNLQSSIDVPKASQLTSDVLSSEGIPAQQYKPLIRACLVVAAFGGVLTLAVAGAIDSMLSSRGRRGRRARMSRARKTARKTDGDVDAA